MEKQNINNPLEKAISNLKNIGHSVNETAHALAQVLDQTIEIEVQKRVGEHMALSKDQERDGDTGTRRKDYFFPMLDKIYSTPEAYPLTIVLFDLDHLKDINTRLGHAAGDDAIRTFSELVIKNLRTDSQQGHNPDELLEVEEAMKNKRGDYFLKLSEYTFRLGGDEFGAILKQTNSEAAKHVLGKITNVIATHEFFPGTNMKQLTTSIGAITLEEYNPELSTDDIFKTADKLLQISKDNGRNQYNITNQVLPPEELSKSNYIDLTYLLKEFIVLYDGLSNQEFRKKITNPGFICNNTICYTPNDLILQEKSRLYHFDFGVTIYVKATEPTHVKDIINIMLTRKKQTITTKNAIANGTHHIYKILAKLLGGPTDPSYKDKIANYTITYTQFIDRLSGHTIDQHLQCLSTPALLNFSNTNLLEAESDTMIQEAYKKLSNLHYMKDEAYTGILASIGAQKIAADQFITIHDRNLKNLRDTHIIPNILKILALQHYLKTTTRFPAIPYNHDKIQLEIYTQPGISDDFDILFEHMRDKYKILSLANQVKTARQ